MEPAEDDYSQHSIIKKGEIEYGKESDDLKSNRSDNEYSNNDKNY